MSKAESSLTQVSCCKASPDICFSFSTFGLYFLQIMLKGFFSFHFPLDLFLFLFLLFLSMIVLFGTFPSSTWYSGPFRSYEQCKKALVTSASHTLWGVECS